MPQAERRTQAQRSELSEARMLESAMALIVEQGTAATSLKLVGERAGYSRGLASQRFGSRDGLFAAIVRGVGEEWLAKLTGATRGRSGYAALAAATDEHLRFCTGNSTHLRAFYILWFESVTPHSQLNRVIGHIHQRRYCDVLAWIEAERRHTGQRGLEARAIASQFCAAIIGIVYYWLANPADQGAVARQHADLKATMRLILREEIDDDCPL